MATRYSLGNLLEALRDPSLLLDEAARWMRNGEEFVRRVGGRYAFRCRRETPHWIASPATYCVLERTDLVERRRSAAVLDAREIDLRLDEPTSSFEASLVGVDGCTELSVTAHFQGAETSDHETFRFTNSPAFDVEEVPFRLESSTAADRISIAVDVEEGSPAGEGPFLTLPVARSTDPDATPIFVVSVDTFHFDYLETFAEQIETADEFVAPAEPRTQGYATPQSHATMLTGVHPGDHGYQGIGVPGCPPIHGDLTTIPEFLTARGYRCLGLSAVSHLAPKWGFGRGFHRYAVHPMTKSAWLHRENDASDQVTEFLTWIDAVDPDHRKLFGFLHVFDPHSPYVPPLPLEDGDLDLSAPERDPPDIGYVDADRTNPHVSPAVARQLEAYYERAVTYTGSQIDRFLSGLADRDLFDRSLIVVTGDHGAEFYERGRSPRKTLYDANVRPGMLVKPPATADVPVPDAADTIDFFPTIATLLDEPVPDQCQGDAWQEGPASTDRLVERIHPEWYNVAVERDGVKAILTYEENNPTRPTAEQVERGPVYEEYYDVAAVRDGDYRDVREDLSEGFTEELRETAERFVLRDHLGPDDRGDPRRVDRETREMLENLGYR